MTSFARSNAFVALLFLLFSVAIPQTSAARSGLRRRLADEVAADATPVEAARALEGGTIEDQEREYEEEVEDDEEEEEVDEEEQFLIEELAEAAELKDEALRDQEEAERHATNLEDGDENFELIVTEEILREAEKHLQVVEVTANDVQAQNEIDEAEGVDEDVDEDVEEDVEEDIEEDIVDGFNAE